MLDRLVPSKTPTPAETQKTSEFYKSVWQFVDTFDAFTKRVIWLKYDYEFKVQRSDKQIAELMCCSEETVRKSVVKYCKGVAQEILCSYSSV
jgi:hypothetical protein